jgi:hypothetical protein
MKNRDTPSTLDVTSPHVPVGPQSDPNGVQLGMQYPPGSSEPQETRGSQDAANPRQRLPAAQLGSLAQFDGGPTAGDFERARQANCESKGLPALHDFLNSRTLSNLLQR